MATNNLAGRAPSGTALTVTVAGVATTDDYLYGTSDNDVIFGSAGAVTGTATTIDATSQAGDTMEGGAGDDIYVVNDAQDVVIENAGEGDDTVYTAVAYTLSANVENIGVTKKGANTTGITATGNNMDNTLDASLSTNADTLQGMAGNDTYFVALATTGTAVSDTVNELVSSTALTDAGGTDTIFTTSAALSVNLSVASTISGTTLGGGVAASATTVGIIGGQFIENVALGGTVTGAAGAGIIGNALNNRLIGNGDQNTITGNAGNDTLDGGNDTVGDALTGGAGDDTYIVRVSTESTGVSVDAVTEASSAGTDTVRSYATYTLPANVENLILMAAKNPANAANNNTATSLSGTGNTLANYITGNGDANTLSGGVGADTLNGGSGADNLAGGTDNDTYYVDNAGDVVSEKLSEGTDIVMSSIAYTLPLNVENLTLIGTGNIAGAAAAATGTNITPVAAVVNNVMVGNSGDNTLSGFAGDDSLSGGAGNDSLDGGEGKDTLDGGIGNDTMLGGNGADSYVVNATGDVVDETSATDSSIDLVTSSATFSLTGTAVAVENLTLTSTGLTGTALNIDGAGNTLNNLILGNTGANSLSGAGGDDTLKGDAGNDTLSGGAGNDSLDGGAGTNALSGGAGNDTYVVTSLTDTITETSSGSVSDANANAQGIDTIASSINFTLSSQASLNNAVLTKTIENLTLTGASNLQGEGNSLSNVIVGNNSANVLTGLDGNDRLDGSAGADTMYGGAGNDTYIIDITNISAGVGSLTVGDQIRETVTNASSDAVATKNVSTPSGTDTAITSVSYDFSQYSIDNPTEGTITATSVAGGANIEDIVLAGTTALTVTGTTGDNLIIGNSAAGTLNGNDGNDTLNGGLGNDTLSGGNGNDVLEESTTNSYTVYTPSSSSTATSTVTTATPGGDDVLYGNAGNDTINAGLGNDTVTGGTGADTVAVGAGNDVVKFDIGTADTVAASGSVAGIDAYTDLSFNSAVADRIDLSIVSTSGLTGTALTAVNALNAAPVGYYGGVVSGSVTAATFVSDMNALLHVAGGAGFATDSIGTITAAVVNVTSGDLNGHQFLAVDLPGSGFAVTNSSTAATITASLTATTGNTAPDDTFTTSDFVIDITGSSYTNLTEKSFI